MACDQWSGKLDPYLDRELPDDEDRALLDHLRSCTACAVDVFLRVREKRAIQAAGMRFAPDPAFRARMARTVARSSRAPRAWGWPALAAFATAIVLAAVLSGSFVRTRGRETQLVSELVDLHVATLASANPVDVISTDRHTVKPWFEGKLPFTFDLPELQGTEFTLIGGRTSYLNQSAGAELIFRVRQHNISVFIFPERTLGFACGSRSAGQMNFHVLSWTRNDLCYFMVGDVNPDDLDKLAALLKS
jgi:anti-sigma factor RsiW